jgi:hypothetical protein
MKSSLGGKWIGVRSIGRHKWVCDANLQIDSRGPRMVRTIALHFDAVWVYRTFSGFEVCEEDYSARAQSWRSKNNRKTVSPIENGFIFLLITKTRFGWALCGPAPIRSLSNCVVPTSCFN